MSEIKATIIAHSKSSVNGKEIVTWELEYPRFIHSELMTHRLFSRNAASSRAIPVAKMIEQVRNDPAMPIHWGKNQPGMQAKNEWDTLVEMDYDTYIDMPVYGSREEVWIKAAMNAVSTAESFDCAGYHKQIVNRLLEPFQMMKTVLTATEFDNFFWLRKHPDAQPEIKYLAELMWEALQTSKAKQLHPGWWHTPYFDRGYWCPFMMDEDCYDNPTTLDEALAISSSCCAQVSYRKLDDSLEKALDIFEKLIESKPCHASPTEHQASPMKNGHFEPGKPWQEGVTHVDKDDKFWSGNFKGWIQHRQLIKDNVCWKYEEK